VTLPKLHYHPGNANLAPHILLEELGASYELVYVDRKLGAHKTAEYLALNPNGLIPVWVDGKLVLYETAAICLHLADTHLAQGLAPALGSAERAHFYKWLMWLSGTLQSTLMQYFYPERIVDESNAGGVAQVKAHSEVKIGALLDQLDAQLASHRGPWLLGQQYTAVDPYALMLCRWTRSFERPARARAQLGAYLERVLSRPAVQRAFAREELAPPFV
jgi:glutathione S-transferase